MGLYVTINSFSQLTVTFSKTNQRFDFQARWGEQHTPAVTRALERRS
jgi:type VI protein secretion system component VasA